MRTDLFRSGVVLTKATYVQHAALCLAHRKYSISKDYFISISLIDIVSVQISILSRLTSQLISSNILMGLLVSYLVPPRPILHTAAQKSDLKHISTK